jgi:thiol-disulfide isomerase/thioredoxin
MFIYKKYGTLTNQTDTRVMLPLIKGNDTVSVNSMNAKVVVLDYWYTGCGACFRRFPDLEVMHKKYANDKEVLIAAVQIPFKNEPNAKLANEWIAAYSFPRFSTLLYEDSNPWQISKFPYVLIFDKHKKLRYKGMLITEDRPLVSNTYDLIEKLKKE